MDVGLIAAVVGAVAGVAGGHFCVTAMPKVAPSWPEIKPPRGIRAGTRDGSTAADPRNSLRAPLISVCR